jgi:N utilization substance protein B
MARRSKAREVAVQMLYQLDLNPDVDARTVRGQIAEQIDDPELQSFTWQLFAGTMECRPEIDARLEAVAANWRLGRMAATDRNVLRLGTFELLHTETPYQVVIDEAIELARKFGASGSAQFVNGLLDRLVPADKKTAGPKSAPEVTEAGASEAGTPENGVAEDGVADDQAGGPEAEGTEEDG